MCALGDNPSPALRRKERGRNEGRKGKWKDGKKGAMRKEEKCGMLFSECDMAVVLLNFFSSCEYSEEICVRLDPFILHGRQEQGLGKPGSCHTICRQLTAAGVETHTQGS